MYCTLQYLLITKQQATKTSRESQAPDKEIRLCQSALVPVVLYLKRGIPVIRRPAVMVDLASIVADERGRHGVSVDWIILAHPCIVVFLAACTVTYVAVCQAHLVTPSGKGKVKTGYAVAVSGKALQDLHMQVPVLWGSWGALAINTRQNARRYAFDEPRECKVLYCISKMFFLRDSSQRY